MGLKTVLHHLMKFLSDLDTRVTQWWWLGLVVSCASVAVQLQCTTDCAAIEPIPGTNGGHSCLRAGPWGFQLSRQMKRLVGVSRHITCEVRHGRSSELDRGFVYAAMLLGFRASVCWWKQCKDWHKNYLRRIRLMRLCLLGDWTAGCWSRSKSMWSEVVS